MSKIGYLRMIGFFDRNSRYIFGNTGQNKISFFPPNGWVNVKVNHKTPFIIIFEQAPAKISLWFTDKVVYTYPHYLYI